MIQRRDFRWLFAWRDVRNFVRRVSEAAVEDNLMFLASGLTFDALLAAIPFGLLALSVLGHFVSKGAGAAQVDVAQYLRRVLPADSAAQDPMAPVVRLLERVVKSRGTLGALGIPLFVWFSTRLFGSLRASLNEVFDTEESRPFFKGKLVDVALVIAATVLFVVNAALTEGVQLVAVLARRFGLGLVGFLGVQALGYLSIGLLFILVFKYAPSRGMWWRTAAFAAVICSVSFEVAKVVLAWYFQHFMNPQRITTDATVGGALVFVAWMYYMTFVFLIGGEIAQVYQLRRRQAVQRELLRDD